ncbi:MAG: aminoglycoside phosphotransferase family protein [Paracoccaceae bacterium]
MTVLKQLPAQVLTAFKCSGGAFVAETDRAVIWKVKQQSGKPAALKIYHGKGMGNEARGFDFLTACNCVAAAYVIEKQGNAALVEWLDGPSLGDMVRGGDDRNASVILADVAHQIYGIGVVSGTSWPSVADWLNSLFALQFDPTCPQGVRQNFGIAQVWAKELLANQNELTPLHGDLHHDNVRLGARGYCAFDAKGVIGEKCYELANSFRNPVGADALVRDPARINGHADIVSERLGVDRGRLLKWAAVKCALSISWRAAGPLCQDVEFDLLELLIGAAKG